MNVLKRVQPYFLWGAYGIWLISLFLPHPFLGVDYPSTLITLQALPVLGTINLLLALICLRGKSVLASLPLCIAFYITWFVGSLVLGV